jgi:hypothetical protein
MIRYSIIVLAIIGTAATAIAAITPNHDTFETPSTNVTVIEKNQAFPQVGPIYVEDCEHEDCSEESEG